MNFIKEEVSNQVDEQDDGPNFKEEENDVPAESKAPLSSEQTVKCEDQDMKYRIKEEPEEPDECESPSTMLEVEHVIVKEEKKEEGEEDGEESESDLPLEKRKKKDDKGLVVRKKLGLQDRPFACDICGKCYFNKNSIERHMRKHNGNLPYSCDMCGISFPFLSDFERHMICHREISPFVCEVCGKSFPYEQALKTHSEVHNKIRRFTCDVCNEYFFQRYALFTHMRKHMDELKFFCNICKKQFSQIDTLNNHMHIHIDDLKFICSICKKPFAQNSSLNRHRRLHTGDLPSGSLRKRGKLRKSVGEREPKAHQQK